MPVRRFDGIDDELVFEVGDTDVVGAWSFAAVLRQPVLQYGVVFQAHTAGDQADGYGFQVDGSGGLYIYNGPSTNYIESYSGAGFIVAGRWHLVAVSKPAGMVAARFRSHNLDTGLLQKTGNAATQSRDAVAVGVDGHLTFGSWESDYRYSGDIAAAAVWDRALSDAQIDELAGVEALASWADLVTPRALWLFNQLSPVIPVDDLVGAAVQYDGVGTTALLENPPIAYHPAVAVLGPGGWVSRELSVHNGAGWQPARSVEKL